MRSGSTNPGHPPAILLVRWIARRRDALIGPAERSARAPAPCWRALPGAIAGLVLVAPATALAKPGALWGRILHSALLMALVGALLGTVLDPLPVAIIVGALVGALGVRLPKLALGLAVGVAVGLLVDDAALAGAATALVYRCSPPTRTASAR